MSDEYERLACTIIEQACKDYKNALKALKKNPRDTVANHTCASCERFFRGGWFHMLCDLDGESIIQKLREQSHKKTG